MFRLFRKIIFIIISISTLIYFFIATNMGLHALINTANYFLPGKLTIHQLDGDFIHGIKIKNLDYQSKTNTVSINALTSDWTLKEMVSKGFMINNISVNDVHIKIFENKNATPKNWKPPKLRWLKFIHLYELTIKNVIIENNHQPTIYIPNVEIKPQKNNYFINANLKIATALAQLQGIMGKHWDLTWKINIPKLETIISDSRGNIKGSGKIQGENTDIQATGKLRIDRFVFENISAKSLNAQFFTRWNEKKAIADLSAHQLNINGFQVPTSHVKANIDFTNGMSVHAALKETELFIPQLKVQLKNMVLTAEYQLSQSLHFKGSFQSGEGYGKVNGIFEPEKEGLPLELKIEGKNVLVANLPEYKIQISPQLLLTYKDHETHIQGDLLQTSARITPADFSAMATLPEEAVIIDKNTNENVIPQNLSLDIQLSLTKDTYIAYENLQTHLNGQLWISKKVGSLPIASGELYTVNGSYRAYGQTLKINQGRLIYAGNLLTNPGLDIKASKKIETLEFAEDQSQFAKDRKTESIYQGSKKIKVGVLVKGSLKKPYVSFFSNPAGIAQNDILSYLIFGYPRSKIKDVSNLAMLGNIISSLNTGSSRVDKITEKIQNVLGLHRVNVTSVESIDLKTNKSEMNTAVNIEKKLGKKFSIQYRMGLFHALYVLNLKYKINKLFSIQSETSNTDKGADLLFEYEHD